MHIIAAKPRGSQRPRATTESTPADAPRKPGRPAKAPAERIRELPVITVRAEPELLARLDAIVARRNQELALQGATTSRGALATIALREFCDRHKEEAAQ